MGQKLTRGWVKNCPTKNTKKNTKKNTNPSFSETGDAQAREDEPESDDFEEFWATYPRRAGKKSDVRALWATAVGEVGADRLLGAARAFRDASTHTDRRYIPYPSTWLRQDRWREWVDRAGGSREERGARMVEWIAAAGDASVVPGGDPPF